MSEPGALPCTILFFGKLPDLTGVSAWEIPSAECPDVRTLLDTLFQKWPALRPWEASLRVAVNLEYANLADSIPPGAEVAVMTPVQGG